MESIAKFYSIQVHLCLFCQALVQKLPAIESRPLPQVLLQTASGDTKSIVDCVSAVIWLPGMKQDIVHTFIVVKDLIAPAIVGVDFSTAQVNCRFFKRNYPDLLNTHYCSDR